ncbi:MAG: class I SAM-dependent methyltransferase, partial [Promethearchaeota archaeon]
MSYIYMKSLEKRAQYYNKGIKLLTLGKLPKIKQEIITDYLKENEKILDIGMGTGTFAMACAQRKKHLQIIGIDKSEKMLSVARKHIEKAKLSSLIEVFHLSVVELENSFQS